MNTLLKRSSSKCSTNRIFESLPMTIIPVFRDKRAKLPGTICYVGNWKILKMRVEHFLTTRKSLSNPTVYIYIYIILYGWPIYSGNFKMCIATFVSQRNWDHATHRKIVIYAIAYDNCIRTRDGCEVCFPKKLFCETKRHHLEWYVNKNTQYLILNWQPVIAFNCGKDKRRLLTIL